MPDASYSERRRQLKARILHGLSVVVSDGMNWEVWDEAATKLEIGEAGFQAVLDEVSDELWRRSVRLTRSEDTDLS